MISVVLVGPENPGNIGAVARVMSNFGFKSLILISPKAKHLSDDALRRAKHSSEILRSAKIESIGFLKKFDYVIATTSKLGSDYNIKRLALSPEQAAEKIASAAGLNIALVFGRESTGLTNTELGYADFVLTIPAKGHKALNLSHAVAVVLYELSKRSIRPGIAYATAREKSVVFQLISGMLDSLEFATAQKKETQKKVISNIIGKSMMTKREAFALIGLLKKIIRRIQAAGSVQKKKKTA